MNGAPLPSLAPVTNAETDAFWRATATGTLLVRRCTACGEHHWYPRVKCPYCHSTDTEWVRSEGEGSVYTFTIVSRSEGPYREAAPYVVAYVELDEGPRLMANVVGVEPEAVSIGQRVKVCFEHAAGGPAVPRFRPA